MITIITGLSLGFSLSLSLSLTFSSFSFSSSSSAAFFLRFDCLVFLFTQLFVAPVYCPAGKRLQSRTGSTALSDSLCILSLFLDPRSELLTSSLPIRGHQPPPRRNSPQPFLWGLWPAVCARCSSSACLELANDGTNLDDTRRCSMDGDMLPSSALMAGSIMSGIPPSISSSLPRLHSIEECKESHSFISFSFFFIFFIFLLLLSGFFFCYFRQFSAAVSNGPFDSHRIRLTRLTSPFHSFQPQWNINTLTTVNNKSPRVANRCRGMHRLDVIQLESSYIRWLNRPDAFIRLETESCRILYPKLTVKYDRTWFPT